MGSKSIIFFGILISVLFLYFCINRDNLLYPQALFTKTETKVPTVTEPIEQIETVVEKKPDFEPVLKSEDIPKPEIQQRISIPAFGFMSSDKNQIVALMSDNDENGTLSQYIEELCQKEECVKDMRFENDIIDATWQKEAVKIITLIADKSIKKGSLFIEGNALKLEGEINNQKTQDTLNAILKSLDSDKLKVENYTKLNESRKEVEKQESPKPTPEPVVTKSVEKPAPKEKEYTPKISKPVPIPEPVLETTYNTSEITTQHSIDENIQAVGLVAKPYMTTTSINEDFVKDDIQQQINDLLLVNPIQFKSASSEITTNSKKTLNKIIDIINISQSNIIEVSGYTDSSGEDVYNKVLSQKRADIVKKYLKDNGVKSKEIRSIGYGQERPIASDPRDSKNRRVEIRLINGDDR